MNNGWIKISRRIMEMDGYFGEKFSRPMCWIDLLLLAEWQTEKSFYIRGNKVVVKRGQIAISIDDLSKRWRISTHTVQRRLREFIDEERILINRSNIVNIITIVNYDKYQNDGMQNGQKIATQNAMQNAIQKPSAGNSLSDSCDKSINKDTMQNATQSAMQTAIQTAMPIKNNKNIRNNREGGNLRFLPPSIEEVKSYIQEKGYSVDAEQFVNFYESKGWLIGKNKMKNWHAAIATWQKREKERNGNFQQKSEDRHGSLKVTATCEEDYSTSF